MGDQPVRVCSWQSFGLVLMGWKTTICIQSIMSSSPFGQPTRRPVSKYELSDRPHPQPITFPGASRQIRDLICSYETHTRKYLSVSACAVATLLTSPPPIISPHHHHHHHHPNPTPPHPHIPLRPQPPPTSINSHQRRSINSKRRTAWLQNCHVTHVFRCRLVLRSLRPLNTK